MCRWMEGEEDTEVEDVKACMIVCLCVYVFVFFVYDCVCVCVCVCICVCMCAHICFDSVKEHLNLCSFSCPPIYPFIWSSLHLM